MQRSLSVFRLQRERSTDDLIVLGGGGICIASTAALLAGHCAECKTQNSIGGFDPRVLAILGMVYGILTIVTVYRSGRTIQVQWMNALALVSGILLVSVAITVGLKPCFLCVGFWLGVGTQFVAFRANDSVSKLLNVLLVAATVLGLVVNLHESSRSLVRSMLVPHVRPLAGLPKGSVIPKELNLPQNGVIMISKDCPVCWQDRVVTTLNQLKSVLGNSPTVVYMSVAPRWATGFPIRKVDREFYRLLQVDEKGVPMVLKISEGRVESFKEVEVMNR